MTGINNKDVGKMNKVFTLMMMLSLSTAAFALDLKVKSSIDGAKVYESFTRKDKKFIGETPLHIPKFDNSKGRSLVVEKKGYNPVYLPISSSLKNNVEIDVELKTNFEWSAAEIQFEGKKIAEKILDEVLVVQHLIDNKNLSEAMPRVHSLRNRYPDNIAVELLFANALLVGGKIKDAHSHYLTLLDHIPEEKGQLRAIIQNLDARLRKYRAQKQGRLR